jgi:hypothetical protein
MFRRALLTAIGLLVFPGLASAQGGAHTWEPFQPLTADTRPALRSAPAAAGWANGSAVAVWVDGRSVLPDIYGAYWQDGQPIQEFRAAHRTPTRASTRRRCAHPAVVLETVTASSSLWADDSRIRIIRGDFAISPTQWTSPTVVDQLQPVGRRGHPARPSRRWVGQPGRGLDRLSEQQQPRADAGDIYASAVQRQRYAGHLPSPASKSTATRTLLIPSASRRSPAAEATS